MRVEQIIEVFKFCFFGNQEQGFFIFENPFTSRVEKSKGHDKKSSFSHEQ